MACQPQPLPSVSTQLFCVRRSQAAEVRPQVQVDEAPVVDVTNSERESLQNALKQYLEGAQSLESQDQLATVLRRVSAKSAPAAQLCTAVILQICQALMWHAVGSPIAQLASSLVDLQFAAQTTPCAASPKPVVQLEGPATSGYSWAGIAEVKKSFTLRVSKSAALGTSQGLSPNNRKRVLGSSLPAGPSKRLKWEGSTREGLGRKVLSPRLQEAFRVFLQLITRPETVSNTGRSYQMCCKQALAWHQAATPVVLPPSIFNAIQDKLRHRRYGKVPEVLADVKAALLSGLQQGNMAAGSGSGNPQPTAAADALAGIRAALRKIHEACFNAQASVSQQAAAVKRPPLPASILENREPYVQGSWRKQPYVPRPYEVLEEYKITEEKEVVEWKLSTGKCGGCTAGHCCSSQSLGSYRLETGKFETECSCLFRNTECDATCSCDAASCLNCAISKKQMLQIGVDVREIDAWGFDCYTRKNIQDALLQGAAFVQAFNTFARESKLAEPQADGTIPAEHVSAYIADWIDLKLIPTISCQGPTGWDILSSLAELKSAATLAGDSVGAAAAEAVEKRVRLVGSDYFRVHPKGVGLVCTRPEGLPKLTFVQEYLGEMYPPWRWFELQDAIKKCSRDELPDFYNIILERPQDDDKGYDVLFIDAASKGSFASRMSHSCAPNCQAVVMACAGRLTIAVYTMRPVAPGEELTFDYASVTESEREFRAAICLCSAPACRGSFLYFAGSRAFMQVLSSRHNMLHRQNLLLRAGAEPLTDDDRNRLQAHGVRDSALLVGPAGPRVPAWLEKWAALTLQFIEEEERLLPSQLLAMRVPGANYTPASAAAEARGVRENRLQNVVITLDKVKLCLSKPEQPQGPPLRVLSPLEMLEHLWSGEKSVAKRVLRSAAGLLSNGSVSRALLGARTNAEMKRIIDAHAEAYPLLQELAALLLQPLTEAQEARLKLLEVVGYLRQLDVQAGGGHTAACDILHLYASTQCWFTAEREYKGFTSSPVKLDLVNLHLDRSGPNAAVGQEGPALAANAAPVTEHASPSDEESEALVEEGMVESLEQGHPALAKKYGPWFIWGQLNGWYKQTVYDPSASLSAERRGTLSLPDIESCYGGSRTRYGLKDRQALLEHLEKHPDNMWKSGTIFSFRNETKVYGSPMFDAVWLPCAESAPDPLQKVLQDLRKELVPWKG